MLSLSEKFIIVYLSWFMDWWMDGLSWRNWKSTEWMNGFICNHVCVCVFAGGVKRELIMVVTLQEWSWQRGASTGSGRESTLLQSLPQTGPRSLSLASASSPSRYSIRMITAPSLRICATSVSAGHTLLKQMNVDENAVFDMFLVHFSNEGRHIFGILNQKLHFGVFRNSFLIRSRWKKSCLKTSSFVT